MENNRAALCFARYNEYVYAGLSSNGDVLRSVNLSKWDNFLQVGDEAVVSMIAWKNWLFMGTSPNGKVWVHDFATGTSYESIKTKDQCVSSFAIYNKKIYAATSPQGIVYSFDGKGWKEEYIAYGSGVTSMSGGNLLYVFLKSAETAVSYNGYLWSTIPLNPLGSQGGSSPIGTVASFRKVNVSADLGWNTPPSPCHNIYSSVIDKDEVVFGGQGGSVFRYNGESMARIFQTDSGDVLSIVNIGTTMNIAAIGKTIYLLDEGKSQ